MAKSSSVLQTLPGLHSRAVGMATLGHYFLLRVASALCAREAEAGLWMGHPNSTMDASQNKCDHHPNPPTAWYSQIGFCGHIAPRGVLRGPQHSAPVSMLGKISSSVDAHEGVVRNARETSTQGGRALP